MAAVILQFPTASANVSAPDPEWAEEIAEKLADIDADMEAVQRKLAVLSIMRAWWESERVALSVAGRAS